ncbi:MAG: LL-diaminopimelate aminotransferase, partial [Candidatus Omnitrophota bacterium]
MRKFEFSQNLRRLPPYLFAQIDRQKQELKKNGVKFIDLSIGDPDIPAPKKVIDTLYKCAKLKENQKYA